MEFNKYLESVEKQKQYDLKHPIRTFFRDSYYFIFWGIPRIMGDAYRSVKWGFQRMFRGYDDTAIWSLDNYLTSITLPVLKWYRINKHGIPWIENFQDKPFEEQETEWNRILDEMILAFQSLKDADEDFEVRSSEWHEQQNKQIEMGLALFAKYYRGLWD